jgi:hypothetical protein
VGSPPTTFRFSTPPSPNSFTGRFSGIKSNTVLMASLNNPTSALAVLCLSMTLSVARKS